MCLSSIHLLITNLSFQNICSDGLFCGYNDEQCRQYSYLVQLLLSSVRELIIIYFCKANSLHIMRILWTWKGQYYCGETSLIRPTVRTCLWLDQRWGLGLDLPDEEKTKYKRTLHKSRSNGSVWPII